MKTEARELRRVDEVYEGDVERWRDALVELALARDRVRGAVELAPVDVGRAGDVDQISLSSRLISELMQRVFEGRSTHL